MRLNILMMMSLMTLGSGLAAQETSHGRETDPVRSRPRSLLDPQQAQGRRMPPELTTVPSDVRDTAALFSAGGSSLGP